MQSSSTFSLIFMMVPWSLWLQHNIMHFLSSLKQYWLLVNIKLLHWFILFVLFWAGVSCSPGWSGTCYLAKNDLESLILQLLHPKCWEYWCASSLTTNSHIIQRYYASSQQSKAINISTQLWCLWTTTMTIKISPRMQEWHLYLGDSQQLSNWT